MRTTSTEIPRRRLRLTTLDKQIEELKAKKIYADQQAVSRAEEGSISGIPAGRERWGRTMEWDASRNAAVAAVTVDQVNAAFKKHIGPLAISIVKGGDFKKAGAYQ